MSNNHCNPIISHARVTPYQAGREASDAIQIQFSFLRHVVNQFHHDDQITPQERARLLAAMCKQAAEKAGPSRSPNPNLDQFKPLPSPTACGTMAEIQTQVNNGFLG
jgi:hypothetical protein